MHERGGYGNIDHRLSKDPNEHHGGNDADI